MAKKQEKHFNIFINGYLFGFTSVNELMSYLLTEVMNLKYSSSDALLDGFEKSVEIVKEFCKEKKIAIRRRFLKDDFLSDLKKIINDTQLRTQLYELVLSLEGKSRLHGFKLTNKFGDRLSINPEIHSIRG